MRLIQFLDPGSARVGASRRGRRQRRRASPTSRRPTSWPRRRSRTSRRSRSSCFEPRPTAKQPYAPLLAPDGSSRRCTHPIRLIASSRAPASRISAAPRRAMRCTRRRRRRRRRPAHRLDAHVPVGVERAAYRRSGRARSPSGSTRATAASSSAAVRRSSRRISRSTTARSRSGRPVRHRADGTPVRLGFAIGNEFSDHVTERQQLPLSRAFEAASVRASGPELRTGTLPAHLEGMSRIRRGETCGGRSPFSLAS